jgi:hypothetical protein
LLLTQRSHERPGGAPARATGDHPRPPARRGPRAMDDARLPGRRAGGPGDPGGRERAQSSGKAMPA